ncbi:hypothetical protein Acor_66220 [Acrocarpospora corrugata]|uniref:Predicted membrane protein YciQ-like C-terminal domain-containing protein n=1 Tax=Acrocarpospora corrugata TaxID=35763 RepID=A0A5M3W6W6_9ACTN|nr:DUF2207 domain-containing protein [Acrocarpospora corrugata]GES04554.1 hypothetical protein Acor_66220 [Acrocarpospora corrugata]
MVSLVRQLGPMVAAVATLLVVASPARADQGTLTLELRKDGVLHVKEDVVLKGGPVTRTPLLRTRHDDASDRVYRIANVKGATFDGAELTVAASGSVEYDVIGAVAPLAGGEELRWFVAEGPQDLVTVKVTGPGQIQNLACFAGEPGASLGCTAAAMDETGQNAEFEQQGLAAGQVLTIVVGYPAGTTGASPTLEHRFSLSAAFTVNAITGGSLALLLVLLLGGLWLVYWTRGRDARVIGAESGARGAFQDGRFAPPDGVRPGQIGTLIDEQADVIDVTATIVDLAVRGYMRIDEQPRETYDAPDWLLVKLPKAPVASLLPYERALYDSVFDLRDEILLSQLHGGFTTGLGRVRDALYRDVVKQGWFIRRPDSVRSRWTVLGVAVTVLGLAGTVALAMFSTYGLVGLAVIIAGAALTVGGQYMPAKTASGAAALAHTLGFREYLATGDIGDVPAGQRAELFSRYLPYAVIFDSVDRWARVVASIKGEGDNLYWYHGPAEWDLSKFADSMRTFTMTTSGAISASRQFKTF